MKIKWLRIPAFLLAVVIICSLFLNCDIKKSGVKSEYPVVANAVTYVGVCGDDCKWTLNMKLGTLTIEGNGKTCDFQSRDSSPWYKYRKSIEKIDIAEGVESIGSYFFAGLYAVKSVTFPGTLTEIGNNSFYACSGIKNIIASRLTKLEKVGDSAFAYCRKLETLPSFPCLKTIGKNAFFYCYSLSDVSLSYSVSSIGSGAFNCCTSLSTLKITNFKCDIFDSENTIYKNTCIESINESTAKGYADKYSRKFNVLQGVKYLQNMKAQLEYSKIGYNGNKKTPSVKIKGLTSGKDYTVRYENNVEPGIANVIIEAAGEILGEKTLSFKITPQKVKGLKIKERNSKSLTFEWESVHGAAEYEVFMLDDGKWKKVTVTAETSYKASSLSAAEKYSFKVRAVASNNCKGNFSSIFSDFTKPNKPDILSINILRGGGKLKVNVKKQNGVDGYEIFMASKENGNYKKAAQIDNNKNLSVVISKLSNSKTYYFKVRSYIKNGKSMIYSKFSSIHSSSVL